jgi:hypothetical protein
MSAQQDIDELQDYHGHHVIWCTNHDDEFTGHSEDEPYCSKLLHGVELIHEGAAKRTTMWVQPTAAFTHGRFTPAEHAERDHRYDGIELFIESWCGPDQDRPEQKLRLTSDAARSLAAALVRAADIEQGLTR